MRRYYVPLIVAAVLLLGTAPVIVVHLVVNYACNQTNSVRNGITVYIDGLTAARLAGAKAAVKSPSATAEQKRLSQAVIDGTPAVMIQTHEAFKDKPCVWI